MSVPGDRVDGAFAAKISLNSSQAVSTSTYHIVAPLLPWQQPSLEASRRVLASAEAVQICVALKEAMRRATRGVQEALWEALLLRCYVDGEIARQCSDCGRGRTRRVWLSIEVECQRSSTRRHRNSINWGYVGKGELLKGGR